MRSQEERWPSTSRFASPHRGTSRSGGWEKKANVERPRRCVSSPVASGKPGTICPEGTGPISTTFVLGPAGLFLLDSKNYSGEAIIEAGEFRVRWLEDPEDGWVCHGMVSRMRAASAEFKERIEAATGVRVWIQPVVVLWMPFPQGVAQLSDVFFVQGEFLADWLRKRGPHGRSFDPGRISGFLQGKAATTAPAPEESLLS